MDLEIHGEDLMRSGELTSRQGVLGGSALMIRTNGGLDSVGFVYAENSFWFLNDS